MAGSSPTTRDQGRPGGGLLAREAARRQAAWRILAVLTDVPRVEDGFAVVAECAAMPRVLRGRFRRDLAPGDPVFPWGLYRKLDYQADDEAVWTTDMWLLERGAGGGLDWVTQARR